MVIYVIYACALLSVLVAAYYAKKVASISIEVGTPQEIAKFKEISGAISEGAMAFLNKEYTYVGIFAAAFALLIYVLLNDVNTELNEGLFSAIAFWREQSHPAYAPSSV